MAYAAFLVPCRDLAGWPGPSRSREAPDDPNDPSTALVNAQLVFADAERLALAGFLAGYRGLTREAYILDLRQFTA